MVYVGTFGGLVDGTKNALDRFAAGEARDYTFVVTLDGAADDTNQGKTPSTTFNWAPGAARGRSLTGDTLVTVRRPGPAAAS